MRTDPANSPVPISVLVQTKNEEAAIGRCLAALIEFDEVIVVDSNSTDRTAALAKEAGRDVVNFTWDGAYPKKKQWQLDNLKTKHEWILLIDADEIPSRDLIDELRRLSRRRQLCGAAYDIQLDYTFSGRLLRHGHRVVKRTLLRRNCVQFPIADDIGLPGMGELEGHYQPTAYGAVRQLRGRLIHDDPDPIATWFDRHNRYSDWEAGLRARHASRQVQQNRSRQGRLFDRVPGKPVAFFMYGYLFRRGFLDGRAGFDYALALTFYYWQIGLKVRENARRTRISR